MYKILSLLWLLLPSYIFIFHAKIGQSRDKILYILLAFVFYQVMMVAIANPLNRLGNAGKCIISALFPYFLWQWSIPTLLFKFIIF